MILVIPCLTTYTEFIFCSLFKLKKKARFINGAASVSKRVMQINSETEQNVKLTQLSTVLAVKALCERRKFTMTGMGTIRET